MAMQRRAGVRLELWTADDLPVLERVNSPEMMVYLGGPETAEQLRVRHEKYLALVADGAARAFTIHAEDASEPVGTIGYWASQEWGQPSWEAGWAVATAYQRRGYARAAVLALLRDAAGRDPGRRLLYAIPRVDNAASNRLCASLGFEHRGDFDDEYPPGHPIRSTTWVFDLSRVEPAGP